MDQEKFPSNVSRAARCYILPAAFCVGDGYWSKNVIMRLCSHGCGGMADIERKSMSRKDLNMDNNSIRKHNSGFLAGKRWKLRNVSNNIPNCFRMYAA